MVISIICCVFCYGGVVGVVNVWVEKVIVVSIVVCWRNEKEKVIVWFCLLEWLWFEDVLDLFEVV